MLRILIPANTIDYVLLGLILIGMIRGFSTGFLQAFVSLVGLLVAWVAAGLLAPAATVWLDTRFGLTARVETWFGQWFGQWTTALPAVGGQGGVSGTGPTTGLPPLTDLPGWSDFTFPWTTATVVLVFIGLLLLFRLSTKLVAAGIGRLANVTPVTALGNRILGGLFGGVRTIASLALILGLAATLPVIGQAVWFRDAMASSIYGQQLAELFLRLSPWLLNGLAAISLPDLPPGLIPGG